MPDRKGWARRACLAALIVSAALAAAGCGLFSAKKKVSVAPVLAPLARAEMPQLFDEVNRVAALASVRGKIDVQFLDTSFAECGVADKYRTADGDIIIQRPGQIYLAIKAPFGVKIAEMTSDGRQFWVAIYQGDERYRRFVHGTNAAQYARLPDDAGAAQAAGGGKPDCGNGQRDQKSMSRAVSSLSSLRPQHLTDALMVPPVAAAGNGFVYAVSESFEDEPDTRPGAGKNARVVRGYYVLVELEPQGEGRARVARRFWFDRVGAAVRLARVQNYDGQGQLTTDVVYRDPRPFGAEGARRLPGSVELTRPQDRYSVRITFQSPEEVVLDKQFDPDIFILQNTSDLPEVDLDKQQSQ